MRAVMVTDGDGSQWLVAAGPDDVLYEDERAKRIAVALEAAPHVETGIDHVDIVEWFLPGPELLDAAPDLAEALR